MSVEAVPDFLHEAASAALEYKPCAWYGCAQEVHYVMGPGAGYCHEHGLEKIRANQRAGVETKRNGLTPLAQKVLAAARALDTAEGAARKAEQRRVARSAEMRDAVRELILAMSSRAT